MATRRRTIRAPTSNFEDDEFSDLVLKLQSLLPNSSSRGSPTTSQVRRASKIMKETCDYIKRLQSEVDDLGGRLSQLLASLESNGVNVDVLRTLLQQ